jgi:hypothetical protein
MCKGGRVGDHPVVTGEAWRQFCERLSRVGDRILEDDFPSSPFDRAEGVRHLANQVACWLTYALGSSDPDRPVFFRSMDPVYLWGGPNIDQVARRALIAGEGVYRVAGEMGSCEDFVLQVKPGQVQSGGADVEREISASDLGIGPGDAFEIVLGGPRRDDGRWVALAPGPAFVHIRDYYFDWRPRQPATFVIERLDDGGAPSLLTPERVAAVLDDAAAQVEHSIVFWNDYQRRMRSAHPLNTFSPAAGAARGVQDIVYSHAFVALAPDEAMVVELDGADAAWWGVQLYNRTWYEPLDFAHRTASRNQRQVSPDGRGPVTLVIAGRDPGIANWLDTEGRDEVLATVRWWRPVKGPSLRGYVTPLASLPAGLDRITEGARAAETTARAAHVAWRFRT